jgi:hypothetical protein
METTQIEGVSNRVLKRIFRPKTENVIRGWNKLHNENIHNIAEVYSSLNVARVSNSRRMRWEGCVSYMEDHGRIQLQWLIIKKSRSQ